MAVPKGHPCTDERPVHRAGLDIEAVGDGGEREALGIEDRGIGDLLLGEELPAGVYTQPPQVDCERVRVEASFLGQVDDQLTGSVTLGQVGELVVGQAHPAALRWGRSRSVDLAFGQVTGQAVELCGQIGLV